MLSKQIAIDVLNLALATGADFAEIYVQNKYSHFLGLAHKRVDACSSNLTYGASIRLMLGTKCVFGYTSEVTKASLMKLALKLSGSFSEERKITVEKFTTNLVGKKNQPKVEHSSVKDEERIAYLKKAEEVMYGYSPLIIEAGCSISESDENVEVFNSNLLHMQDRRVRTRLGFAAVASKDGMFQTGYEAPGGSLGDELMEQINQVELAKSCASTAVELLSAPECPSGKMTVIIGNKFGGVLFHESCGHPLEGTAISHKTSVFTGKIGQKIASDIVSAIDDGTIENGWGSSNFDDEGEKTTRNQLIKDGVLVSYMMDNFDGKRMNMASTGACRRESYRYLPTTRMTNTFIDNGTSTPEEIIKNTKLGLYCVSFNGGSVDPSTDKFNFTASKAYIIKDGKIDHLVRDASLVGYGYEVLMNIDMVGNDLDRGQGMCGAASGSVPADVGQPTIRIQNVTVGGRGGNI